MVSCTEISRGQIFLLIIRGASKKVVELATMTGAKSMKGTPYWKSPEVILQTGHSLEPDFRPTASDLLQVLPSSMMFSHTKQQCLLCLVDTCILLLLENIRIALKFCLNPKIRPTSTGLKEVHDVGSVSCSAIYTENFWFPDENARPNIYRASSHWPNPSLNPNFQTQLGVSFRFLFQLFGPNQTQIWIRILTGFSILKIIFWIQQGVDTSQRPEN